MTILPNPNPRVAKLAKETLAEFRNPGLSFGMELSCARADNLEQKIAEAIWKYHQEQEQLRINEGSSNQ